MRKITLFLMSLFLTVGAMAQELTRVAGVNQIPTATERFDLSQGLVTGYYLLKQVNNHEHCSGGGDAVVGWIKANGEEAGQNATCKNTGTPTDTDATYIWYVEVLDGANRLIKISTANKIASWCLPENTTHVKPLKPYGEATVMQYHHKTSVNLGNGGENSPKQGSAFISNYPVTSYVHFSGTDLGSWTSSGTNSTYMVEFYKLDESMMNFVSIYEPTFTGEKTRSNERLVASISVANDRYTMPSGTRYSYTDLTATKTFTVQAGTTVTLGMTQDPGKWMNAFVYVDMDKNGFTAGIADNNYTPTGDLVSYSFYNQGYDNDHNGRNSDGTSISGDNRSTLTLPNWTVPADLAPGEYRIRFKYDWCNINPYGDTGTYFSNTFVGHGGEIIDFTLKVVKPHTLKVTDAGWATLFLDFPAAIPTDVDAYIVTGLKDDNWLELAEVEDVIPANTGVLVNANANDYIFNYSTTAATTDCRGNKLEGSVTATTVKKEAYVLGYAKDTKDVVFGKAELTDGSFLNNANKAYLPVSALTANVALSANLRFDFGGTTAIEEVETEAAETVIYDLTGRRVNEITKAGVYVVNGRKILVK